MQLKNITPCHSCPKRSTCGLIDCSEPIKNIWCDDFKAGQKESVKTQAERKLIDPYLLRQMPMSNLN
jgi:hypothetical protein